MYPLSATNFSFGCYSGTCITVVVLSAKVLSMAISVVLVIYDIAIMPSGDYILALYDMVIIKHYFASGIPVTFQNSDWLL